MTDVCVYHFWRIAPAGENIQSKRRATLEAITHLGEAVFESRLVVDHTEVDENGFMTGNGDDEGHPMDALWAQIRSFERRALSRDSEVLRLKDDSDKENRDILSAESLELREQAQALRRQRVDLMTGELGEQPESRVSRQIGLLGPTTR